MSVLIKDTTREQRIEIISRAMALASLDPSFDGNMKLYEPYINGEKEISEIAAEIIAECKEKYGAPG